MSDAPNPDDERPNPSTDAPPKRDPASPGSAAAAIAALNQDEEPPVAESLVTERWFPAPPGSRLLSLAALAGIVVVLKLGQELIVPLLVAVFMAILLAPMVRVLVERRVPRSVAVPLVLVVLLVVFSGLGALIGSSVGDFTGKVPFYRSRVDALTFAFFAWLNEIGIAVSSKSALAQLKPGMLFGAFGQALSTMASAFSSMMLVLLLVVFMLFEAEILPGKLRAAFGDVRRHLGDVREAALKVQRYLWVKTIVSVGTGIGVGLFLWLAGVDFPVLWGVCAFLLNYVPNIGSLLAAVPPVLLALVQHDPARMGIVALGLFAVNFVFGNVLEPRMLGRQLGLSTFVVFLSLIVFGYIWGVAGMLLSTPLVVVAQIACASSPRYGWISILLGGEAAAEGLETPALEAVGLPSAKP
ncbi:MAG: AI-2E family transporter [Myxococcales bacterium]|nr:AI-2E family transporter [Myxococcales bacterium]